MSSFAKGGRGKKAPYESQMYRVPVPIKPVVKKLAPGYRLLVEGALDPQRKQLLSKVEDAIATSTHPSDKLDIKNSPSNKLDIKNEGDDSEDEDEEELESTEDLEQVIREQASSLQELIVDNRMLEREKLALQTEREQLVKENNRLTALNGDLRLQVANCKEQLVKVPPTPPPRTIIHSEAIALLQSAITPKTKGGSYAANNATGLKKLVEQALALLEEPNEEEVV